MMMRLSACCANAKKQQNKQIGLPDDSFTNKQLQVAPLSLLTTTSNGAKIAI